MKYKYLIMPLIIFIIGCQKDFLDTKPSSNIVQPTTLKDLQNLLESNIIYNSTGGLPQLASDEYYYQSFEGWEAATTPTERNSYIWAKDIYGGDVNIQDWNAPYQAISYANNVLEILNVIKDSIGRDNYNFIKGWAYFVRAYELYDLAKNFAQDYDSSTASTDLGIPLKLKAGIDNIEARATVKNTYTQILADCEEALLLLPTQYPMDHQNHPSKIAAYALFARIYLNIRNYKKAGLYADSSLSLYSTLLDYNTISISGRYPFPNNNAESLYTTCEIGYPSTNIGSNRKLISVDTVLLKSYNTNDLRRSIYFQDGTNNNVIMRGGYYGLGLYPYSGLAVDEMYLIRSECNARIGNMQQAIDDLNTLLSKRFKTGTFQPLSINTTSNILELILSERRKELVWRGLRWSDLKRLNKDGANITISRIMNGISYILPPNDPRYIFNIPSDEIALSGIQQNPR